MELRLGPSLLFLFVVFSLGAFEIGTANEFTQDFLLIAWKEMARAISGKWPMWWSWRPRFLIPDSLHLEHQPTKNGSIGGTVSIPIGGRPIQAPDLTQCGSTTLPPAANPEAYFSPAPRPMEYCCIPISPNIVDFKLPPPTAPLRVRPAAHSVTPDYIAKYTKAVELMKSLPADDPRNFNTQGKIHCAYCNNAYQQSGFSGQDIQIHFSWLFYPWHRCFLYFYERILGKLIGDDTFALPFWNWDSPPGMSLPLMYTTNSSSPLFNPRRDPAHQPPAIIDLDFDGEDADEPVVTDAQRIDNNLKIMYRQLVSNAKTTKLFVGAPYRRGDPPGPGAGSLEFHPHGPVHLWSGDARQPNREDMGTLYSAAFDPLFFAHHGNIDRLWVVWREMGGKHTNYKDWDWLETEFLFYDENAQLVRIKIRDCVDEVQMRYTYQKVDIPWLNSRPRPAAGAKNVTAASAETVFPVTVTETVSGMVRRVATRSSGDEVEVLVVGGIELARDVYVKLDVFVNAPPEMVERLTPAASEFAGSFVNTPNKHAGGGTVMTSLRLAIADLLEDLEVEEDESIVVTLVPRKGNGKIRVGGLSIEFTT